MNYFYFMFFVPDPIMVLLFKPPPTVSIYSTFMSTPIQFSLRLGEGAMTIIIHLSGIMTSFISPAINADVVGFDKLK